MRESSRRRPRLLWGAVFLGYFLLVLAPAAQAYLDPGSGSMFFQILIGGLVAGAVAIRAFWGRIVGFFRRKPKGAEKPGKQPAESID